MYGFLVVFFQYDGLMAVTGVGSMYVCCHCACWSITDGVCWCARFRSLSQERSSASSWSELITHPHKQKELANYCSLLQEHYYQSYVRGTHTYVHKYTQCSVLALCIRNDGMLSWHYLMQ